MQHHHHHHHHHHLKYLDPATVCLPSPASILLPPSLKPHTLLSCLPLLCLSPASPINRVCHWLPKEASVETSKKRASKKKKKKNLNFTRLTRRRRA
ncbi:hypothetical protein GTR04_6804 [Trichophyton interdigitale]|nr:hypothetical protein GY631_6802 [Trichophyton interdigitale]KAG5217372.1 hypothetical protein GY632_6623 [Trichophyton interdigitale]KAG8205819.1 hypothetical protein GTR04_6804 [Trichophyton interdigitale]